MSVYSVQLSISIHQLTTFSLSSEQASTIGQSFQSSCSGIGHRSVCMRALIFGKQVLCESMLAMRDNDGNRGQERYRGQNKEFKIIIARSQTQLHDSWRSARRALLEGLESYECCGLFQPMISFMGAFSVKFNISLEIRHIRPKFFIQYPMKMFFHPVHT